jgi:tRNA dimethylallyltransferase
MSLIPIIVVVGPTASGKTRLAVDIALKYNGEVVSADSMQIYKGMDIGTAKPSKEEMRGVPHHMMDMVEPKTTYSVAQYVKDAHRVITDINARGRLPILAGGTGLYVNTLIDNIEFGETERDDGLRRQLGDIAAEKGGGALLEMLRGFDPQTAETLHPNNTGRIIRAIEVYKTSGMTMTQMREKSRRTPKLFKPCMIGLGFENRSVLYSRIDARVDAMMQAGLEGEVRELLKRGIDKNTTAMQAIGYKEIAQAISEGRTGSQLSEAVEEIKLGTRHYAKRQLTWFRRDTRISWIEAGQSNENICQNAFNLIENCEVI